MSLSRFVIDNYVFTLLHYTDDFSSESAQSFFNYVHERFNEEEFVDAEDNLYVVLAKWFRIIKQYEFSEFIRLYRREVVASLTSFPERISGLTQVIDSIVNQTRPVAKIILWLAKKQFPNRINDLPDELVEYYKTGLISIQFCDDLRSHKKYYYAFQKYQDSLIVTFDDDLIYHKDSIENLFLTYLEFPFAVAALRTHLMIIDENKEFVPYSHWILETSMSVQKPSMQVLATGGAGALYDPKLFDKSKEIMFDKKLIKKLCPLADDIWLKAMEVVSGVPVVLSRENRGLKYLPGTQEVGLYHINIEENLNDVQLADINDYLDEKYGKNFMSNEIMKYDGFSCSDIRSLVSEFYEIKIKKNSEIAKLKRELGDTKAKLKKTERQLNRIKNSRSFKFGHFFAKIIRRVINMFSKKH